MKINKDLIISGTNMTLGDVTTKLKALDSINIELIMSTKTGKNQTSNCTKPFSNFDFLLVVSEAQAGSALQTMLIPTAMNISQEFNLGVWQSSSVNYTVAFTFTGTNTLKVNAQTTAATWGAPGIRYIYGIKIKA